MTILNRLNTDIILAYKSGETDKRIYLQTLKSEILTKSKNLGKDLDDQEEIQLLRGELKKQEDSLSQFKGAGRDDLVKKVSNELDVLKAYLPEDLSDEKIEDAVKSIIEKAEDKSFGNIMRLSMSQLRGKADGGKVAQIVKGLTQDN